jgi:thioredoxin-related protein
MRRSRALLAVVASAALLALGARAVAAARLVFRTDLPLAKAIEEAKSADRMVVADLVSASCTWCKALERDTYSSADVAKALEPAVCVRYDAATVDGGALVRRFAVHGFPTVLFLDGDGEEVDRIVGYRSPERFLREVARIKAGEGTLKSLRLAHEKDPSSATAAAAYARRLVVIGETSTARSLLRAALASQAEGGEARGSILLGLAEAAARLGDYDEALGHAVRASEEAPEGPEASQAWILRVDLHARRGEIEAALAEAAEAREHVRDGAALATLDATTWRLLRRREESTLERWGERADAARDATTLHSAARAALDSRMLLGTALRWAERAAELSSRDGAVLVTLAWLHAENGAWERAAAIAQEAEPKVRDDDARARLEDLEARLARVAAGAELAGPIRSRPASADGDAVPAESPKPSVRPPPAPTPRPPAARPPAAPPPNPRCPPPPCPPPPCPPDPCPPRCP